MGYLDVPLILLSLAIVFIGKAFWTVQSKKRRALLAISQRNQYFDKLEQDSREMTHEVNKKIEDLEHENQKLKSELDKFKFTNINHSDRDTVDDLERIKHSLEQRKLQEKSLEKELAEICSRVGLDYTQNDELSDQIKQLESNNKLLESQLESLDKVVLPTKNAIMDQEIMDYLKHEGNKYSLENLDALYEKLLDEKVADPNGSLEAYESRIQAMDYESEQQRLDVERRRIERIHEREKSLYEEDNKAFREAYIEFCFKIPAVREEYNSRKELNDTDERLVNNCRKMESRRVLLDKSWRDDQENYYP